MAESTVRERYVGQEYMEPLEKRINNRLDLMGR